MINSTPAKTITLDDFIEMKPADTMTYYNFSILNVIDNVSHLDRNLIEEYIDVINLDAIEVQLSVEEYKKYKYAPDLLAYDIYGSTQLDFLILLLNDMIDPKQFNKKNIKLLYSSKLVELLDIIYSKESNYIQQNRYENGLLF